MQLFIFNYLECVAGFGTEFILARRRSPPPLETHGTTPAGEPSAVGVTGPQS